MTNIEQTVATIDQAISSRLDRTGRVAGGMGAARGGGGSCWGGDNRRGKSIAFAGDGLHEAGTFGVVAKGVADFADGGVDAVFDVDEDFCTPEAFGNFRPGDELAIAGGQQDEQLHRLSFKLEASTGASELKAVAIQLEVAEFEDGNGHWKVPPRVKYSIAIREVWRIEFNPKWLLLHPIFTWKFTCCVLPREAWKELHSLPAGGFRRRRGKPMKVRQSGISRERHATALTMALLLCPGRPREWGLSATIDQPMGWHMQG